MSDYRETLERWLDTGLARGSDELRDAIREALAEVERLKEELEDRPYYWGEPIKVEITRLERERDEYNRQAGMYQAQALRLERERDEARAEVERLKAERGEFSDVLHRATLAEAKIEAALAECERTEECDVACNLAGRVVKALTEGRE